MTKEFSITGMTCSSCVSKVEQALAGIKNIDRVEVQIGYPQAKITSEVALDLGVANSMLSQAGSYRISSERIQVAMAPLPEIKKHTTLPEKNIATYKPLILIVTFIAGIALLVQYPFNAFSGMLWMRHFMAGFFIVFAFFKLLNLKGFADSYSNYDIVAGKWKAWGYVYPFVELTLGVLYLINIAPFPTNLSTVFILGVSSIGVIKSNLDKRKIKCACLGDVFNLPMSTVTIVEDLTMVTMAVVMIIV